jgi:VWFA-related protein
MHLPWLHPRLRSLALPIALIPLALAAQQPAPPPPPDPIPTLTAVTREVLLDVVVTDGHGHSVKGLHASDLLITEDGVQQTLKSFAEHTALSPAQAASLTPPEKLPPHTFSNFAPIPNDNASTVILIDALDTPVDAQMYARQQVIDYMKTVPAGASVALFLLDTRIHLIQGFSSDPQALLDAVQSKRYHPVLPPFTASNAVYQRFRRDALRDGMQTLGRYLSGFPGRKNLVWFTGIIPRTIYGSGIGNPFRDTPGFVDDLDGTTDVLALSRVAIYPVDARGLIAPPAYSAAFRSPAPHGTALGADLYYDHASLDDVAEATGGLAFYNTNGLKSALAQIIDTGANYYTVSYTPTNRNWNGSRRSIHIEAANPAYVLQYRHSYIAHNRQRVEIKHLAKAQKSIATGNFQPVGEDQPPDAPGAQLHRAPYESLQASMTLGAIPPTELIFSANVTPAPDVQKLDKHAALPPDVYLRPQFASKPFRDYDIFFATDPRHLSLTQTADNLRHGQVEFVAVVYNDQGDVVNSIIAAMTLDLRPETYTNLLTTGLTYRQSIAVPAKGNYFLRLGLRDVPGDHVGAMEIPIDQIKLDPTPIKP